MVESKLARAFDGLNKELKDGFTLAGDCLLVEFIPEEEIKRSTGLYIPVSSKNLTDNWRNSSSADKPVMVRVLKVGPGYYDDLNPEKTIPLSVKPRDIILVGRTSTLWFSAFGLLQDMDPNTIGLTRESEIKATFHGGDETYKKVFDILNSYFIKAHEKNTDTK